MIFKTLFSLYAINIDNIYVKNTSLKIFLNSTSFTMCSHSCCTHLWFNFSHFSTNKSSSDWIILLKTITDSWKWKWLEVCLFESDMLITLLPRLAKWLVSSSWQYQPLKWLILECWLPRPWKALIQLLHIEVMWAET